jgi:protocatechuate 3,4-dioxygenase, beta subunit
MSQTPSKAQTSGRDAAALAITPPQIVGPFYPVSEHPDLATDLARPSGSTAEALGQLIHLSGRVLTRSGAPVPHARIDIWQANAAGKYRHPSDINPAPLDPNFKGFARLTTDAAGHYSFRTVKPGRYPTAEGRRQATAHSPRRRGAVRLPGNPAVFRWRRRKRDRPLAQCGPASGKVNRYSAKFAITP